MQVPAKIKPKKDHDGEYNWDLARKPKRQQSKKETVRKVYIENESFTWGPEQQKSFDAIKSAIANNPISGTNPQLQFHLAVDASETALGGVLF